VLINVKLTTCFYGYRLQFEFKFKLKLAFDFCEKYTVGNRQNVELCPTSVSSIHSPFIKWITIHRHPCQTAPVLTQTPKLWEGPTMGQIIRRSDPKQLYQLQTHRKKKQNYWAKEKRPSWKKKWTWHWETLTINIWVWEHSKQLFRLKNLKQKKYARSLKILRYTEFMQY